MSWRGDTGGGRLVVMVRKQAVLAGCEDGKEEKDEREEVK